MTQRISGRTYNNPPKVKSGWVQKNIVIMEDDEDDGTLNLLDMFYDTTDDMLQFSHKETKNFTITISSNGDVKIKPKQDWYGTETLVLMAGDGQNQYHPPGVEHTAQIEQTVIVEAINDKPKQIKELGTLEIFEDPDNATHLNLNTYFDDSADGQILDFNVIGQDQLTIRFVSGTFLEITPPKDWNGMEKLTISASDGQETVQDTLTVVVRPVNDPPVISTSSINMQSGKWNNATILVSDVDVEDNLHISIDIQGVLSGLIPNDNFIFNPVTGELSIEVSNKMVGTYKFNATANDGTTTVTKTIKLVISKSGGSNGGGDGGDVKGKFDYVNLVIIPVIIVIIILIVLFLVIKVYRKSQKISLIKCPSCSQSVVRKGKGEFKCEVCGTMIDPSKLGQTAPVVPPVPQSPYSAQATYRPEPEPQDKSTRVSGGHYPKSVLGGSFLDNIDQEPAEPVKEKREIPMAVPIARAPPPSQTPAQAPAPAQVQAQAQPTATAATTTTPTAVPTAAPTAAPAAAPGAAPAQPQPAKPTKPQTQDQKQN
jgi:hypothetical protein